MTPLETSYKLPLLNGLAESRLDETNQSDLVAIRRPVDGDLLSRFLQDHWMFKTTRLTEETEHIVESHITWVAGIFSTSIAALLLLGAIIALRLIKQQDVQLGMIAIFTILFSASVKVMTNARGAEIFVSTAAYAAVLVVFVSSSPSSPNSTCCASAP